MRGTDETSGSLFSYVDLEERIPARHPLRKIRRVVNDALVSMDAEFARLYAADGRPSIAPERLLRASLIQILFSVRSERQLMEQMQYNLLFRWFVGLGIDDPVWVATVFSKNRDRLLTTDIAQKFLAAILAHCEIAPLLSDEHFSVDGTLIKAWASVKSFQPKPEQEAAEPGGGPDDPPAPPPSAEAEPTETKPEPAPMTPPKARTRNAEVDFRGQKRSNATHASVTDPEARLYKKSPGAGAVLCFMGHALMENRHGFVVQAEVTQADGHAERKAALDMVHRHSPGSTRRLTLGADKAYDAEEFVQDLRQACVTPHVAQKARFSAINGRTTRHEGYALSQRCRTKIDLRRGNDPLDRCLILLTFGWAKTVGPMVQTMLRGVKRVGAQFTFTMAACNLARLPRLLAA
ncbi:IS5-like element ISRhsp7 family transposase [Cereibacter azotoformans]|uniref:Transposase, IS4 family n=1 Tax=Cereibacter sphaeroides (strain ATCC 17025 / ATH 2.4.3) TaxID=349102 RepID=A4WSG5_CERS5|nr:IS5-like element ISRhsp7 family transposase [Cereibacter azotoformans]ULB09631.1 IS5-like element ISRhsp7 family transposase [Cereibacter azotoformans]